MFVSLTRSLALLLSVPYTMNVKLTEDKFGQVKDDKGQQKTIKRFTWTNSNKVSVQVITYGGYITSIKIPDNKGAIEDITLGFDNIDGYLSAGGYTLGATIGRVANKIGKAKMTVEGVTYNLAANNGVNHLHGGVKGFDKVIWESYVKGTVLFLSYHSVDMEEGYPGDVIVTVSFQLTDDNDFLIDYKAATTKPCPINLTNHSYFNLAGNGKGSAALYKHVVSLNADKIIEGNSEGIPTETYIMTVTLTEDEFDQVKDNKGRQKTIKRFTWTNSNKVSVQVITYGGYITSINIPDKKGAIEDITLGFKNIGDYLSSEGQYFGATVGRTSNRIGEAKMTVEGVTYNLAANNGVNHIHGGAKGFDKMIWESYVKGTVLYLSYHSDDMEEGYPGDVIVTVSFQLTDDNDFVIDYKATTTKPCPVTFTNHSYFNLAGNGKGSAELYKHVVSLNADKIVENNSQDIPTGKLLSVANTIFDLRVPKVLGDVIHKVPGATGYEHNFCITKGSAQRDSFFARVSHPESGRVMEVYSDLPGVCFYTGNYLPEGDDLMGKDGFIKKHGGFCLETQMHPDSVNQKNFPNTILYPGEQYHRTTTFRFIVEK